MAQIPQGDIVQDSKRIWGWWFFDWASQPYATLLLTFIFPIYYTEVARAHFIASGETAGQAGASAQALWGYGLSIAGVIIAALAPVLGSVADASGRRLRWVWTFSVLYLIGAAGIWLLLPDGTNLYLTVALFGLGIIGLEFTTIFTNALLPGLAPRDDIGRVSGSGFAFGYVGGLVSLAIVLLFLAESATTGRTLIGIAPILGLDPDLREGTRAVGPFTAIWYVVFMIPFALWVREPRTDPRPPRSRSALSELWALIRGLRRRKSLLAWLISSMFSRDALNALYSFGGVYAASVLGWPVILAGIFGITSAIAAAIVSWLGGKADRQWGPMPVILTCSLILSGVVIIVVGMSRESFFGIALAPGSRIPDAIFFACGILIGGAGGALQAASRTLTVMHTSPERATEVFGLYALSGKATAFLAPLLIAVVTDLTGSQHVGVSPLIVMFLLSLILLIWVKREGDPEQ